MQSRMILPPSTSPMDDCNSPISTALQSKWKVICPGTLVPSNDCGNQHFQLCWKNVFVQRERSVRDFGRDIKGFRTDSPEKFGNERVNTASCVRIQTVYESLLALWATVYGSSSTLQVQTDLYDSGLGSQLLNFNKLYSIWNLLTLWITEHPISLDSCNV